MSKITPKNLHYNDTLPPFLARLRANNANSDGRHEYAVARPKKPRNAEEEAEDEPVVFDEASGNTLTQREWEAQEKAEEEESKLAAGEEKEAQEGEAPKRHGTTEKIAAIGASKKRKPGKVIGVDEDEALPTKSQTMKTEGRSAEKGKPAKKKKKMQLSFDDDE